MANRYGVVIAVFGCVIIVLGATIGLILHFTLEPREGNARTDVLVDCLPEVENQEGSKDRCQARKCTWKKPRDSGAPWCTFPMGRGYVPQSSEDTPLGRKYVLSRIEAPSLFGDDVETLVVEIEEQSRERIRVKMYDADSPRYEVPREAVDIPRPDSRPSDTLYSWEVVEQPQFGIVITRKDSGVAVFNTSLPGLTFSDQYLQVTSRLASGHVYGLGEHNHRMFHHDMGFKKWSIFTRDVAPVDEWNLYGAQPFLMSLDSDKGTATGLLMLNSNAMDVVLQPSPHPAVSFRMIGGIVDMYIFMGPGPEQVVQQYTEAVGRPLMVPYWSLGFQLSRWGYANLSHIDYVVERNFEAGIPQDVQYADIDYMQSKLSFTYDHDSFAGLPDYIQDVKLMGKHFIVILDNFIGANDTLIDEVLDGYYPPYYDGLEQDVFVKTKDDTVLLGEVWPGLSVYPDFTNLNRSTPWWRDQCHELYHNNSIQYDALWIDMNEPSNFVQGSTTGCEHNKWNYPPYVPKILGAAENSGMMYDKTICMDAQQAWGAHYDVHSLYGHSHAMVTHRSLLELFPSTRPLVLTRSNFVGTQQYAAHWLGDNQSEWPHLAWSIVGMLEYSLFGFSYTGADICGFWYNATYEMCLRWHQLGAFYPYARNHNAEPWDDQDPAAFDEEFQRVTRDILMTRYKLLPYLYTLMHFAHAEGSTVVRPLLHEFPADNETWTIDKQFLWGPALMISPALLMDQRYVDVYVPQGRWYDYFTGAEVVPVQTWHNLSTPLDHINLHVRGGHVMALQQPAISTVYSRRNPFTLLVALGHNADREAHGALFWDDGESLDTFETGQYSLHHFNCSKNRLDVTVAYPGYSSGLNISTIDIYGLDRGLAEVMVDGGSLPAGQINYYPNTKKGQLVDLFLDLDEDHTITWTYDW